MKTIKDITEEYTRRFLDYYDDGSKNPDLTLFYLHRDFIRKSIEDAFRETVIDFRLDWDDWSLEQQWGWECAIDEITNKQKQFLGKE